MTDLLIRRAKIEDAPLLTELAMRAKASWGYDESFMAQCREELTVTDQDIKAWIVWVAEYGSQVAGMIALSPMNNTAELEEFMVEPAFQGCGIGSALMTVLVDKCYALKIETIGLDADPHAEPVYQKMGFVTAGHSPSGSIPGRMLPRMIRKL